MSTNLMTMEERERCKTYCTGILAIADTLEKKKKAARSAQYRRDVDDLIETILKLGVILTQPGLGRGAWPFPRLATVGGRKITVDS